MDWKAPTRPVVNPRRLRPLNVPQPIPVQVGEDGAPRRVVLGGQRLTVEAVADCWSIHEEWWRQEIWRRYFLLILSDGRSESVYQDLVTGEWFRQRY